MLGSAGDLWTSVAGSAGTESHYALAATTLNYSDGTASGIKVAINDYGKGYNTTGTSIDPYWRPLLKDYLYIHNTVQTTSTITLSGFAANAPIASLILYGGTAAGNDASSFTYSGTTLITSDTGTIGATLTQGDEYVRFDNLLADGSGNVSITWAFANGKAYSILNGMQISLAPVPEPATYGLLGAGALAAMSFVRRRRR